MAPDTFDITYAFKFKDGKSLDFKISLDGSTLALRSETPAVLPDWARLDFHQCPNCPLDAESHDTCPVALSLYKPIVVFKDYLSYEEADVTINTSMRQYAKHTTLHQALSSMMGIYMVTCGCPYLEKLRPMVRFHLPFADENETSYRAITMYLMAQYLIAHKGGTPDWKLSGLVKIYEDIMTVNKGFVTRLQHLPIKDASLNAIVGLDCFALNLTFSLSEDMLDDMYSLFSVYTGKE